MEYLSHPICELKKYLPRFATESYRWIIAEIVDECRRSAPWMRTSTEVASDDGDLATGREASVPPSLAVRLPMCPPGPCPASPRPCCPPRPTWPRTSSWQTTCRWRCCWCARRSHRPTGRWFVLREVFDMGYDEIARASTRAPSRSARSPTAPARTSPRAGRAEPHLPSRPEKRSVRSNERSRPAICTACSTPSRRMSVLGAGVTFDPRTGVFVANSDDGTITVIDRDHTVKATIELDTSAGGPPQPAHDRSVWPPIPWTGSGHTLVEALQPQPYRKQLAIRLESPDLGFSPGRASLSGDPRFE